MTDKTKHDPFETLMDVISGEQETIRDEIFGPTDKIGENGPHILMVDDDAKVIASFRKSAKDYAGRDATLPCQISFFRMEDHDKARVADFMTWLKTQGKVFDAIYLDGDLGNQTNGFELAAKIRELQGFEYKPIAIITAQASFFSDARAKQKYQPGHFRILGKFDQQNDRAIEKLVIDYHDVAASARAQFWEDTQRELAAALNSGDSIKQASAKFGNQLRKHYGVHAWYLREQKRDKLVALAWLNGLQVDRELEANDTPTFQLNLLKDSEKTPWVTANDLSREDVGAKKDMVGYHAIAARLGSRMTGQAPALLTAYRTEEKREFTDEDAQQLHRAAVMLQLARARRREVGRLSALSTTITGVLEALKTREAIALMCDFLHEQINAPLENRGYKTKTTARLFHRGTGELHRVGDDERKQQGTLTAEGNRSISIQDDCVYARTIRDNEPKRSDMEEERDQKSIDTAEGVKAYLAVPLSYNNAVIGALNMECDTANAYTEEDQKLAGAIARVAAQAVVQLRTQRFMTDLAELTNNAINPTADQENTPQFLLNEAAWILYRLTGYSDLLLFERPDSEDAAWDIEKIWSGNGKYIRSWGEGETSTVQEIVDKEWEKTGIYKMLQRQKIADHEKGIYLDLEGLPDDDGDGDLRPEGRKTERHVIIPLDPVGNPDRVLMLLFEHPHPIPNSDQDTLQYFARFLNAIYSAHFEDFRGFKEQRETLISEARNARAISQLRHEIVSHLLTMQGMIDSDRDEPNFFDALTEKIAAAEAAFESGQFFTTEPALRPCDIGKIWNDLCDEHQKRMDHSGMTVDRAAARVQVYTDPKYVKGILFHLLDNALDHGAKNGATQLHFCPIENGCRICDNGAKIDDEIGATFMQKGNTSKATAGGYGLHIAQVAAQDLGGDLVFEHRDGLNCFMLTVAPEGGHNTNG